MFSLKNQAPLSPISGSKEPRSEEEAYLQNSSFVSVEFV